MCRKEHYLLNLDSSASRHTRKDHLVEEARILLKNQHFGSERSVKGGTQITEEKCTLYGLRYYLSDKR